MLAEDAHARGRRALARRGTPFLWKGEQGGWLAKRQTRKPSSKKKVPEGRMMAVHQRQLLK